MTPTSVSIEFTPEEVVAMANPWFRMSSSMTNSVRAKFRAAVEDNSLSVTKSKAKDRLF
jgi:hypothetical protein